MPQKNNFNFTLLARTLMLLSLEELKSFGKWLQSPWCNTNKKLFELYSLLKSFYPEFNSSKLSRENIFKKLYPSKKFNDKWLRNLMAEMNKQIEQFLIHLQLEKDENLKKILLAKEYEKRDQQSRLIKITNQINNDLEDKTNKSLEDYFYLSSINDLVYYLPGAAHHSNAKEHPLLKANHWLDHFYLLAKWRYRSELKERTKSLMEEDNSFVELKLLEELNQHHQIPAVKFYQNILADNEKKITEEEFNQIKEEYLNQQDVLSLKDKKLIYLYLLNILIRIYSQGNNHLMKNIFELYQVGIANQLLIQNGKIADKIFGNIITIGNFLQQFEYISQFIKTKSSLLKEEEQLDGKTWGMAHLCFSKKEYEKTIDLLWPYKFRSINFERSGKFLLLQAYFEAFRNDSSFQSMFFDYIEALKKYVHRDKNLSSERKKAFYNLIKYTGKITGFIVSKEKNKAVFLELIEELNKEKNIQGRPWINKILDELVNGAAFNRPIS